MYFHSEARRSSPCKVRAPHTTGPTAGMVRRQLMPSGFNSPFSASVRGTLSSGTPTRRRIQTRWRFPDAALRIGARKNAGDCATRDEVFHLVVVQEDSAA